jgi:hypothetical protein
LRFLTAGLLASLIAWIGNRLLANRSGTRLVTILVPLWEEMLKTGSAFLLGAPIFWTHAVFGMVEAINDFLQSPKGIVAGLAGLVGHMFFGYLTTTVYLVTGSPVAGLLTGMAAHMGWNLLVIKFADT